MNDRLSFEIATLTAIKMKTGIWIRRAADALRTFFA